MDCLILINEENTEEKPRITIFEYKHYYLLQPRSKYKKYYNMKKTFILSILCLLLSIFSAAQTPKEFTVLQWNIWQEGTMVKGGYEAIVNEIVRLKPDFITFSEVRNYNKTRFCDKIVQSLQQQGETYYSFYSFDSGVLSRYPITDSVTVFPLRMIMEAYTK